MDLSNGHMAEPSNGMAADPDGHEMLEVKAAPKKEWDWLGLRNEGALKVGLLGTVLKLGIANIFGYEC